MAAHIFPQMVVKMTRKLLFLANERNDGFLVVILLYKSSK